jgi:hypothetical protein
MDSNYRALQATLRVMHTMVRRVDARQKLMRYELVHLLRQGEKVDEAKGEFCAEGSRIMGERGEEGSIRDRLMGAVASAVEMQPNKGKPTPLWYVAASDALAPLIQQRNAVHLTCMRNPTKTAPCERLRQLHKEVNV